MLPSSPAPLGSDSPRAGEPAGALCGGAAGLGPQAAARDAAAAVGGYAWWYVEVHDTDEQRFGLTLILFAGSVFSPDYAAGRRAGAPVRGLEVPAVNFSLYERTRGRHPTTQRAWVMNEYDRDALRLSADAVAVARTAIRFPPGGGAIIELDEDTTRFFSRRGPRVKGRITVAPAPPGPAPLCLGVGERGESHFWQPLAARAAAVVELDRGGERVRYRGLAYLDHNYGSGRLEDTFAHWVWAHGFPEAEAGSAAAAAPGRHGAGADPDAALIVYRTTHLGGHRTELCVRYRDRQRPPEVLRVEHPPSRDLAPEPADGRELRWLRAPRSFTAGPYTCERLAGGTLEDTPFYARFAARLQPSRAPSPEPGFVGVGEYLDLTRFRRPFLQYLLRYKTRCIRAGAAPGSSR